MKPGVRKRQQEIEEYITRLHFARRNVPEFDERYLQDLLEEGVYINKSIDMEQHRPVWFQLLFHMEKKKDYDKNRLQVWLKILVDQGAKPENKDGLGLSGLQAAAHDQSFNLLKALVEFLEPNLEKPELCLITLALPGHGCLYKSKRGQDLVTYDEMTDIIGFLLAKGHDPDEALIAAAEHGHITVIEQLLKGGANVNYQNASGVSALMWTFGKPIASYSMGVRPDSYERAKMLLEFGADPNLNTNQRRTCRSILRGEDAWSETQKAELLALLEQHGG